MFKVYKEIKEAMTIINIVKKLQRTIKATK